MASRLAEGHIEAQRRLRVVVVLAIERIWRSLAGYDRADLPRWLGLVLPLVGAGQRQSVSLTEAYLYRAIDRPPVGLDPRDLIGAAVRNGTPPEVVYQRPFIQHWTSLKDGTPWQDSVEAALARAKEAAAMDVQLTQRATMDAVGRSEGLFGFKRAVDADPCDYCRVIDGAYVKSAAAMPLHNHCGCSLEPLTEPHKLAVFLPDGTRIRKERGGPLMSTPPPETVAIHEHGELGPLLTSPEHHFKTEAQALGH